MTAMVLTLIFLSVLSASLGQEAMDPSQHPNWQNVEDGLCGVSVTDRIIGGNAAEVGQFPWLARLATKIHTNGKAEPYFICGGTVIHKRYVVTAGHCSMNVIIFLRVGDYDSNVLKSCLGDVCSPVADYLPEKMFAHEEYKRGLPHDIALIRTTTEITFSDSVMKLCLPWGNLMTKDFSGEIAEAAGWGIKNMDTKEESKTLLTLQLPIMEQEICKKVFRRVTTILPTQVCAGGKVGKDTCNGDSGGPLMKVETVGDTPPRYYLIGITSYGDVDCASTTKPGIYTRLTKYVGWILDNIHE